MCVLFNRSGISVTRHNVITGIVYDSSYHKILNVYNNIGQYMAMGNKK